MLVDNILCYKLVMMTREDRDMQCSRFFEEREKEKSSGIPVLSQLLEPIAGINCQNRLPRTQRL